MEFITLRISENHLVMGVDVRDSIHCIREKSQSPVKIDLLN